jgi:hypothetical protein
MKTKQLTNPFLVFLLGVLIYLLFRSESIRVFDYLTYVKLDKPLSIIRSFTLPLTQFIPDWIIYSLPDGLWLFSFSLIISEIWNKEDNIRFWFWTLLLPFTAIIWELGQALQVFSGTFDWIDTFIYSTVTFLIIKRNKTIYYEKTT